MSQEILLNRAIKAHKILLIGNDGEKIGEFSLREALDKAYDADLDLMQVGESKDIAVCKILDFQAFQYHEQKKLQKQNKINKQHELKTIVFTPNIGENDFNLKINSIKNFLTEGHKVKVDIKFRNRQAYMTSINDALVDKIKTNLDDFGALDSNQTWSHKSINFILKPALKNKNKLKV